MTMEKTGQVFTVEGMSCGHCQKAVEEAVQALPGVKRAAVDLAAKTLTVDYDAAKSSESDIRTAVEDVGFTVA